MNRALLEKPFASSQIRQRQGRNGVLDYIEGRSVIQRLNEALDGAWSFEITHHEVRQDEVIVLGRLAAEGITKMTFGASQVTREKGSGQPVSLGDDLKAAATDALKKCATFLGVGLHLYAEKPLGGRGAASRASRDKRGAPTGGAPGWPRCRPVRPRRSGHRPPARDHPQDRPGAGPGTHRRRRHERPDLQPKAGRAHPGRGL